RHPPRRDRDRARDPVRRADPGGALGTLRLRRACSAAHLARPRAGADRPRADRGDLESAPAERRRARGRRARRRHLRGLHPPRRARCAPARPDLALRLAWAWPADTLNPLPLSGATVTLARIALAQTSR